MRNFLEGCPFNFTSPVEPVRSGPSSFAYSRSLSHLVRFGTSAQSSQICSLVAVVSLFTSMTATLVVVPTIAPDTATATSTTPTTSPVFAVPFFTRRLSLSLGVLQPVSPRPVLLIGQDPYGVRQMTPVPNVLVSTNSRTLRSSLFSKSRLPFPKTRGWTISLSSPSCPALLHRQSSR